MKILKTYQSEELRQDPYGTNSRLLREIRAKYDLDEVVLPKEYTAKEYADLIRRYDVLLTMWASAPVPDELAQNPGNLKYICNITGSMRGWISSQIIESPHLVVTNWGDAPAFGIAEGAFALLMSMMKNIPLHIRSVQSNNAHAPDDGRQTTLYNRRVGIYGLGVIGRKFVEFLKPFQPVIYAYDPYISDIPEGVTMVDSLDALFEISQIVVVHAGLSEETKGSVTKELLAKLPDGAIIINTARGLIIDWEALRQELLSGRLRGGLDMTGPWDLPEVGDPVRQLDNAVFTGHHSGFGDWQRDPDELDITARNCLDNLERFSKGEPLKFIMTPERYMRSS